MKITFAEDHQSYLSGNERYSTGTKADLPRGADLVAQGIALAGWDTAALAPYEQREEIASEPPAAGDDAPQVERVDWTQVKGVSSEINNALHYMGLNTKEALLTYFMENGISALTDIPSVGMKRARDIIAWAEKG